MQFAIFYFTLPLFNQAFYYEQILIYVETSCGTMTTAFSNMLLYVCESSEGLLMMMLGLCDLRAVLLSRFYLVIVVTTCSSFSPHSLCYRSINHLITAMHLLASE